jgi:hypothetical protein
MPPAALESPEFALLPRIAPARDRVSAPRGSTESTLERRGATSKGLKDLCLQGQKPESQGQKLVLAWVLVSWGYLGWSCVVGVNEDFKASGDEERAGRTFVVGRL